MHLPFPLDCIAILPLFPVSNANLPLSVCPCVQPPKQHTSRLAHVIVEMSMGWDSLCVSRWRCCIFGPTHRLCGFLLIRLELSSPLSLMFVNSVPSHFFSSSLSSLGATLALSHISTLTERYAGYYMLVTNNNISRTVALDDHDPRIIYAAWAQNRSSLAYGGADMLTENPDASDLQLYEYMYSIRLKHVLIDFIK